MAAPTAPVRHTFPSPPTLAPIPAGYPPPPYPIQYPHYYTPPCKCELANQIRYYNHRDREFYYHTAVPASTPTPNGVSPPQLTYPYPQFYDPYGPYAPPMAPLPPGFQGSDARVPFYYSESGLCELILVLLALLLWLYSFYRLYLVWQNTLNFSESSIQGPQGWDLLVSWIVERIRLKKLRALAMSTRRRGVPPPQVKHKDIFELAEMNGFEVEEEHIIVQQQQSETMEVMGDTCSVDMSLVSRQSQLKQYLSSYVPEECQGAEAAEVVNVVLEAPV